MSKILVWAESRRGELRDITLELVTAARELADASGATVSLVLLADDPDGLAGAASVAGVDELLLVRSPVEYFEPHVAQAALEALLDAESPDVVLVGHTIDGMGFAPAVAARAGTGLATDVTGLRWEDGVVALRGAYGGKLVAEVDFPGRDRVVLMVRAGAFEPAAAGGSPATRSVDVDLAAAARSEHGGFSEAATGGVDITTAEFLLSVGRGIEDQDNLEQFEELAERFGATLVASRPIVDAGWMPSARQVGQSGKTVKPKVYLAFGISGAVQHLAGMQKSGTIIAVNTDPEAPIFGVAHYGAVCDLFDVARELEQVIG